MTEGTAIYSLEDSSPNFDVGGTNNNETNGPNWAITIFLLIVFAIGMIGNFLVIFVIVVLAEYKKVLTHWYILQLAIADTIFLLTIPLRAAEEINGGGSLPQWVCQMRETMFFFNYYASISFLVLMTIDRYIAICHRFSPRLNKFRKRSVTYISTMLVWLISLVICIPVLMYSSKVGVSPHCSCEFFVSGSVEAEVICSDPATAGKVKLDECVRTLGRFGLQKCWKSSELAFTNLSRSLLYANCHYRHRSQSFKGFVYFNFIGMFVLPFIIMAVCYTLIAVQLKKTRVKSPCDYPAEASPASTPANRPKRSKSIVSMKDNRNRNRVTTMCVCLVLLFLCCWLPFHAVHLAKMRGIIANERYCEHLFHVTFIIAYFSVSSHSLLNPCLYNFIGQKSGNRLRTAASSVRMTVRGRSRLTLSTSTTFTSSCNSKTTIQTKTVVKSS